MKQDYLWDRTGTDAEIESLELLLGGLAFRPAELPELPAREIEPATTRRGWFFRLSLGFAAASISIAALLIAVISMRQDSQPAIAVTQETTVAPAALPSPINESGLEYQITSTTPLRKPRPKKRNRREAKSLPAPQPRPRPVITLTAEELDAYRQLMTALSVTGANLNIVRDKINGSED